MRSLDPNPMEAWPHDMLIVVDDDPNTLLELLWVREARQLAPAGDVPPPLLTPPKPLGRPHDAEEWEHAWPELWRGCLAHAAREIDPQIFGRLQATADGSPERADLLRELSGPSWTDRFGAEALGDPFFAWQKAQLERQASTHAVPLEESPERRSLAALIGAWRAGLTRVITIPCVGDYTHVVGPSALLVTDETRSDPERYSAALSTFN